MDRLVHLHPDGAFLERHLSPERAETLLAFWLGPAATDPAAAVARRGTWFDAGPALDAELAGRFGDLAAAARRGELAAWAGTPRPALARVIALDQLPRHLHRGRPAAFAGDAAALAACRDARARGHEAALAPVEAAFLLMPFQHQEDAAAQDEGVRAYEALTDRAGPVWREVLQGFLDFARAHRDLVARFGRFPHRNAVLGRASTPAELRYLAEGGPRFGQGAQDGAPRRAGDGVAHDAPGGGT